MDIELNSKEIKNRKGSCSTIPSPSLQNPESEQSQRIINNKKGKKITKLKKSSSSNPAKKAENSQDLTKGLVKQNKFRIFHLIKDISKIFNISKDTYLVCLKIVNLMKFQGEEALCVQVAGTIALMVQKIYESYKISFADMVRWSRFSLSK